MACKYISWSTSWFSSAVECAPSTVLWLAVDRLFLSRLIVPLFSRCFICSWINCCCVQKCKSYRPGSYSELSWGQHPLRKLGYFWVILGLCFKASPRANSLHENDFFVSRENEPVSATTLSYEWFSTNKCFETEATRKWLIAVWQLLGQQIGISEARRAWREKIPSIELFSFGWMPLCRIASFKLLFLVTEYLAKIMDQFRNIKIQPKTIDLSTRLHNFNWTTKKTYMKERKF